MYTCIPSCILLAEVYRYTPASHMNTSWPGIQLVYSGGGRCIRIQVYTRYAGIHSIHHPPGLSVTNVTAVERLVGSPGGPGRFLLRCRWKKLAVLVAAVVTRSGSMSPLAGVVSRLVWVNIMISSHDCSVALSSQPVAVSS